MKNKKMTDAYKNAVGTVFLLAGAFFICSTVLADPIAPMQSATSKVSPARTASARNATNARTTVARPATTRTTTASRTKNATQGRNVRTRSISVRNANDGTVQDVQTAVKTRSVSSRANNTTMRGVSARNNARVVARTASTPSRVSLVGTGMRASSGSLSSVSSSPESSCIIVSFTSIPSFLYDSSSP